ncbi:NAD(P)/FAD-dependent oxidoreductase [Arachidicoccus ginsenosidimutans]|uniref:NAD(P)/FAD-dependent oxidoreductase n=1 Tax=Arachidicoccus sp. BS20 TaxID=1850526 RepID=UPI002101BB34|nr:FAD-dependent oxidoreductase [Arachidicoccus sp. BS20]
MVGQGICGTFLSYYLMQEDQSVLVIDKQKPNRASRIASGVINPVTGRRIVKTWKIDELMPFAWNAYHKIAAEIKLQNIINQCSVLDIHTTEQMRNAFEKRLNDVQHDYIQPCNNEIFWQQYFHFNFGIGEIFPAYCINLIDLLIGWRNYLHELKRLQTEAFSENKLLLKDDFVVYKNITAKKIIFCDGISSVYNNYFKHLPFALNKGEALIVSIPDLPRDFIYKQGFSIVPWKENDLFWIGSTYEWNYDNDLPTNNFKNKVETYLQNYLKVAYNIQEHFAGLRPANTERRPFVGLHTAYPQIGILNGMGTKGCTLAPFYANQLTRHLLHDAKIDAEADVQRFTK